MPNYIQIINKEAIMTVPESLLFITLGCTLLAMLIPTLICWFITKRQDNFKPIILTAVISGIVAFILFLIFEIFFMQYFMVPSGRYRYEAVVDKELITASQYEEFIREYEPKLDGDVYYFESDKIFDVKE